MVMAALQRARFGDAGRVALPARKRRGDPLWARLMVLLGALLMMASGGVIVGGRVLIKLSTSSINQSSLLGDAAVDSGGRQIQGALNILLTGIDERTDDNEPARSDSIIILHVTAAHDQAYMISIPRDLFVTIPAVKNLHPVAEKAKINAAFAAGSEKGGREGGFQVLAQTITALTHVSFNAGAIVNFGGFQQLVDALGGVDMCLDLPADSIHIGRLKDGATVPIYKYPNAKPVHYDAGCRHLEGWEALDYVRQRYQFPNGDYDRTRHQQEFLKAVLKRAKSQGVTAKPAKALQVMRAAGKALTLDTNGVELADWVFTLRNVTDNELVMLKTNGGKFNSSKAPDGSDIEQLTDESQSMLAALGQDQLAQFALQHPDFVNSSNAG
jgi:LCP family protein required for cell wall assembly